MIYEMDGPPLAFFTVGEKKYAYETHALRAANPGDLVCAYATWRMKVEMWAASKDAFLVWRTRPVIDNKSFSDVSEDYYTISFRCALVPAVDLVGPYDVPLKLEGSSITFLVP